MSLDEKLKLMGMNPVDMSKDIVSAGKLGGVARNAVPIPLLEVVIQALVNTIDFLDQWPVTGHWTLVKSGDTVPLSVSVLDWGAWVSGIKLTLREKLSRLHVAFQSMSMPRLALGDSHYFKRFRTCVSEWIPEQNWWIFLQLDGSRE